MQLNEKTPIVVLSFQFTKLKAVPASIPTVPPPETMNEKEKRLNRQGSGRLVLGPQEKSSIFEMLKGLYTNGYAVVDVPHEEHQKDNRPGTFQVVKAIFRRKDDNFAPSSELLEKLESDAFEKALEGLVELCAYNLWRTRAYDNPFFQKGEPVEGLRTAAIVCDAKVPIVELVEGELRQKRVWQKDESGERVGTEPQPLVPDHTLRMNNNEIVLE